MRERLRRRLEHPRALLYIVLLSWVLLLPVLFVGLVLDDYSHREMVRPDAADWVRRQAHQLYEFMPDSASWRQQAMDAGYLPWFADPRIHARFWRPVSSLTLWWDHRMWPVWMAQIHSVGWYLLLLWLVDRVFRRLIAERWVASLATLVYAVDEAHAGAVGWIANRNALVAMCFAVSALLLHLRWRQDGCRRSAVAAPLALLLGLWSGEMALSITAYLFAYALFLDQGSARSRAWSLLPAASLAVAWRLAYNLLGYGAGASSLYIDPVADPLRFAGAVLRRLPLLLQAQLTPLSAELPFFFPGLAVPFLASAAVALVLIALACARRVRDDALWRFSWTGMLVGAVPLCAVFAADRLLLPMGIGASVLVATLIAAVKERLAERVLAAFWVFSHLMYSPLLVPVKALGIEAFGTPYRHAARSLDRAGPLGDKQLMVVSAPDFFWAAPAPFVRRVEGKSLPRSLRILSTSLGGATVRRLDDHTLVLRARQSFLQSRFDALLRHPSRRWVAGDAVLLEGDAVTVTELTAGGEVKEIRWHKRLRLDDPSLAWVVWTPRGFVPFELPRLGETREVEPVSIEELLFYRYQPER